MEADAIAFMVKLF